MQPPVLASALRGLCGLVLPQPQQGRSAAAPFPLFAHPLLCLLRLLCSCTT